MTTKWFPTFGRKGQSKLLALAKEPVGTQMGFKKFQIISLILRRGYDSTLGLTLLDAKSFDSTFTKVENGTTGFSHVQG